MFKFTSKTRTLILFFLLFSITFVGPAAAGEWIKVCNERFGTCAEIPYNMKKLPPSDNGDGEVFILPNKFKVSIYGSYNIDNFSTKDYFDQYRNKSGVITYSVIKNEWYVESGFIGDWIFYHKVFVNSEKISGVYIEYPKNYKREFDNIVAHISHSLTQEAIDGDIKEPEITPKPEKSPDAFPKVLSPYGLKLASTGSAFRIDNGTFVTNRHVINECKAVSLNGNPQVRVIDIDKDFDLAILSSIGDIGRSVTIRETDPQLNEKINVAGYPLQGLFSGLSITNGNISRLSGIGGDKSVIQISAPVQPGNSGGPVIDDRGQLVGVVVSKLDAGKLANVTGDISQNINFAINSVFLKKYLGRAEINFRPSEFSIPKTPSEIAKISLDFTVLVECYK